MLLELWQSQSSGMAQMEVLLCVPNWDHCASWPLFLSKMFCGCPDNADKCFSLFGCIQYTGSGRIQRPFVIEIEMNVVHDEIELEIYMSRRDLKSSRMNNMGIPRWKWSEKTTYLWTINHSLTSFATCGVFATFICSVFALLLLV